MVILNCGIVLIYDHIVNLMVDHHDGLKVYGGLESVTQA